jgi:hypothetical protein
MRPSRCWDWPSVAKRGSRLTGLASIRKVSEVGSNFVGWEQEVSTHGSNDVTRRKTVASGEWRVVGESRFVAALGMMAVGALGTTVIRDCFS